MRPSSVTVSSCLLLLLGCCQQQQQVDGFVTPSGGVQQKQQQQQLKQHQFQNPLVVTTTTRTDIIFSTSLSAYVSPEESEQAAAATATKTKTRSLHPKIGDLVRYYDLDGGSKTGQEMVGKITFLTKTGSTGGGGWLAELTELEDVGDGYYAEYGSNKRMSKKTDRDLTLVSPVAGSFVRAEQAYKIPLTADGRPNVRQEMYDLDDFEGPQAAPIDMAVVESDSVKYSQLKLKLLKTAALTGLAGTAIANIIKGPEDAAIYFAGALASVGYLFFLSVKTDTMGGADRKLGSNVANLRFLMPVFVIVGVALYNKSLGDANPINDPGNPFDTVTPEQFASAVLGFLTYRVPLFLGQVQDALKDIDGEEGEEEGGAVLPGSAGMAMKLAKSAGGAEKATASSALAADELIPVLLVSGPQATGRSELVKQLLAEDDRLVSPKLVDRMEDAVTFERLQGRNELLMNDGRFGLTKDAIMSASASSSSAVVVDADVELAKKLAAQGGLAGARLIGVWVGLNSVGEFEERLLEEIDSGKVPIPEDETRESVLRARIKDIINEIEFGLSSGIFEFTILNSDVAKSLKELKEAAGYCFK